MLTGLLPAKALTPDEILPDPVLEQRARELSAKLRCMVCQNQSIDDSDAPLAKDLRILVRERLVDGDSDADVLNYIVSRYGEFVLLEPRFAWHTALLWATIPLALVLGGYLAYRSMGARRREAEEGDHQFELTAAEQERLERLLDAQGGDDTYHPGKPGD
ncbi:MAG: cytochrome c-type biogenesis protein CcmH [Rhodobacteraceae bacterium]|nr:cytochrome c-type biogenesis protein CcmH [Paracoccaceae bacterium]